MVSISIASIQPPPSLPFGGSAENNKHPQQQAAGPLSPGRMSPQARQRFRSAVANRIYAGPQSAVFGPSMASIATRCATGPIKRPLPAPPGRTGAVRVPPPSTTNGPAGLNDVKTLLFIPQTSSWPRPGRPRSGVASTHAARSGAGTTATRFSASSLPRYGLVLGRLTWPVLKNAKGLRNWPGSAGREFRLGISVRGDGPGGAGGWSIRGRPYPPRPGIACFDCVTAPVSRASWRGGTGAGAGI